ncbi:hypothetical protein SK128_017722, partial [Halocaridina rubra]
MYSSVLPSTLVVPTYEKAIDSISDHLAAIEDQKYISLLGCEGFLEQVYKESNVQIFRKIWEKFDRDIGCVKNWNEGMDKMNSMKMKSIFQHGGVPPHWKLNVRPYLNENLPGRWIGCAGDENNVLLKWVPRSPDLTPCDIFSGAM